MLRVNGLFGWVSHNDRRSMLLFVSFVFAFHLLGLIGLFLPLAMVDPDHAPIYNWGGYALRYIPLVTLWAVGVFLFQLWWHVNNVRKQSGFRFTFKGEEPRLCRIAEPLVIAAGLPEPRIAVIESRALNAFACGISQKKAVIVVTRGLIDGLDDEELGAVIAHELMHIRNGDVRLMAAANVCMNTLAHITKRRGKQANKYHEALSVFLTLVMIPFLFLVILVMLFIRQFAIKLGQMTRLLISSSREYMADAEAVRLTQNPAAFVAALQKIDGRSEIENLPPEQDAMMIDGLTEGALATHPTISERIAALIKVTGSMALIPASRRDTRPVELRPTVGFGRRGLAFAAADQRPITSEIRQMSAFSRVSGEEGRNMFGLTKEMSVAAFLGMIAFCGLHRADLNNPKAMAAYVDVRGFSALMGMGGGAMQCQFEGYAKLLGRGGDLKKCEELDKTMDAAAKDGKGFPGLADGSWSGTFSSTSSAQQDLAQQRKSLKCFDSGVLPPDIHRVYGLDGEPWPGVKLADILHDTEVAASELAHSAPQGQAKLAQAYLDSRLERMTLAYGFWGEAGYAVAKQSYTSDNHRRATSILATQMKDAAFLNSLSASQREDATTLLADPQGAQPCFMARRIARGVRR
jgi:Zn-dependent protease with chaperone function